MNEKNILRCSDRQSFLAHLIEETKKGHTFGEWNDYGRLLENI